MYIGEGTLCGARSSDAAGLQIIHMLQTELGCRVKSLCEESDELEPGAVVFLTTAVVRFPSKNFRPLPPLGEASARQAVERVLIEQRMPWLTRLGAEQTYICMNPSRLDAATRRFEGKTYESVRRALLSFCNWSRLSHESGPVIPASEKRARGIAETKRNRPPTGYC